MSDRKIFKNIRIENSFTESLPEDPVLSNHPRQVYNSCYSSVYPEKPAAPELVAFSPETASLLGFTEEECRSDEFLNIFSGKEVPGEMKPYASAYAGHQFGNWAGQLGDGRAVNLCEIINPEGKRFTVQLKGAGPTPYSRAGDGYAVFRSSLREFLCSEAMHHLRVPTTRALMIGLTGKKVLRDMFYDGNPEYEQGAVVARVAPGFVRFGNFELFASRGEFDNLKKLADYVIKTEFEHIKNTGKEKYFHWFRDIVDLCAELVVQWMRVGFVHGVLNTDNMAVNGLTIDYGPYGWLENYDPGWTPNTTDSHGKRYAFGKQPEIVLWNLSRFAEALYPITGDARFFEDELERFSSVFNEKYLFMMSEKLGFKSFKKETDVNIIKNLLSVFGSAETDMTLFFRNLSSVSPDNKKEENFNLLKDSFYSKDPGYNFIRKLESWLESYFSRIEKDKRPQSDRMKQMDNVNPLYVLRNYLAQTAVEKFEKGDNLYFKKLFETLKNPYQYQEGKEEFMKKRPEWARNRPGCSMLSCSS